MICVVFDDCWLPVVAYLRFDRETFRESIIIAERGQEKNTKIFNN